MPFRYLQHIATADIAFEAWGKDLPELFRSAADAVTNTMVSDLESITPGKKLEFDVSHEELDLLLFNFLQELVYFKDAQKLLLRVPEVSIRRGESGYTLKASAFGEELDAEKHHLIVDVKAITLYRFEVRRVGSGWEATVVVDV
jgi:SHS2 domain-containing protein